jgi:plastocyanin
MTRRWTGMMARLIAFGGVLVGVPLMSMAQDATPAAPPEGITVIATGLENPRGFDWGPDGALYVALAGNGGTAITTSTNASPEQQVSGPTMSGPTASVVRIQDGCGVPVVTGLPSSRDPYGDVQGPVDVGFLDGQLYILQDATGGIEAVGPNFPNGIYAANPDGSVRLISDLTAFVQARPAANLYHVLELGEPFAMTVADGGFYVVDANQGLLLRVEPVGTVSLVADLSLNHPVPTAIAMAPDGGIYVGFLNSAPHPDGASKVVKVAPDGTVSDYWTGLTMVTGLALTPDGTLYALDMATNNSETEPNIRPNTGRLVRQTGPASLEEVVTGLDFPISMAIGPDGGLYVSLPAIATDGELGGIIRIDPAIDGPVEMPAGLLDDSPCVPATPTASASPAASPVAVSVPPLPVQGSESTPAAMGDKEGIASLAVQIQQYTFNPSTQTIRTGTIVTWTNLDTMPHTVTAADGSFDSGNLAPGESYVHAIDDAGVFAYACSYHPTMTGTIVVQ